MHMYMYKCIQGYAYVHMYIYAETCQYTCVRATMQNMQ